MTAILLAFIKDALLLNVGEFDFSSDVEVCDISPESLFGDGLWVPPVHNVQNTVSHVSQNKSSCKRKVINVQNVQSYILGVPKSPTFYKILKRKFLDIGIT